MAHRALEIPEILEQLLLSLDQRTLLTAALRVCKCWHRLLTSSPALRRHLFLDISASNADGGRRRNPLLQHAFWSFFADVAEDDLVSADQHVNSYSLYRIFTGTKLYDAGTLGENPFLRANASWLRMHVSDPPTTVMAVHRSASGQAGDSSSIETRMYRDGLRMGELYSQVLLWDHWDDNSAVRIVWPLRGEMTYGAKTGSSPHLFVDEMPNELREEQVQTQLAVKLDDFISCEISLVEGDGDDRIGYQFFAERGPRE